MDIQQFILAIAVESPNSHGKHGHRIVICIIIVDIVILLIPGVQVCSCGKGSAEGIIIDILRSYIQPHIGIGIIHQGCADQIGYRGSPAVSRCPYLHRLACKGLCISADIFPGKAENDIPSCLEACMQSTVPYIEITAPFRLISGASGHKGQQDRVPQILIGRYGAHRILSHLLLVILIHLNILKAQLIQQILDIPALLGIIHILAADGGRCQYHRHNRQMNIRFVG